tara:strand:- start:981 stop:2279 length:1299 start_codon:yes stop_codon:yes gene_type:complete
VLNILHISNNDSDGAGRAAARLNYALNKINGIKSTLLVLYKKTDDKHIKSLGSGKTFKQLIKLIIKNFFFVKINFYKELIILFKFRIKLILYNTYFKPKNLFNFYIIAFNFKYIIPYLKNIDVIIFHSIQEMISIEDIVNINKKYNIKLIFHPLDMEMLTGGYHFSYDCECYKHGLCDSEYHNLNQISEKNYKDKIRNLSKIPISWITTSDFAKNRLINCKIYSSNHEVSTIYMGIEKEKFFNTLKSKAREKLKLPLNKKIMLFGCFDFTDPRKGANLLKNILEKHVINKIDKNSTLLLTYGSLNGFSFSDININWKHLGFISTNEEMNLLYRASDFMLSPSIDDIGPTTVQEAFINSLPVIGFDIGFVSDLINNETVGKKVTRFNKKEFGKFIIDYLHLRDIVNIKKKNIDFSIEKEASLFQEVILKQMQN